MLKGAHRKNTESKLLIEVASGNMHTTHKDEEKKAHQKKYLEDKVDKLNAHKQHHHKKHNHKAK